ncbi:MAG: ornithine carbamoyltransferase [Desulfobacterota bacterium]|nr:ornithine carbamoyltransferase [Thermodesulfobacteriota bacterium]MDW8001359.1 ornithine carbamoyltransferase [Deltaproteobacteria bacterium]
MKRDFTKLLDITIDEARSILERAKELKDYKKRRVPIKTLEDKILAMIFEKASTRTRISFEVAMRELGGHAISLNVSETQMSRGEPLKDTGRVLSRYVSAILIRTYSQETVDELARWSTIPVINGLSDKYHPCQILSDIFTIEELKGDIRRLRISYIGDGNNVANSLIEASILFGFKLSLASPEGFFPDEELTKRAKRANLLDMTTNPEDAVKGADVIYTDVWVSMGQEKDSERKKEVFRPFRIDDNLLRRAKDDSIVLHCLPAHRGEEITDEVFEKFQEAIFTQAENRLHVQKSLLEWLMA